MARRQAGVSRVTAALRSRRWQGEIPQAARLAGEPALAELGIKRNVLAACMLLGAVAYQNYETTASLRKAELSTIIDAPQTPGMPSISGAAYPQAG
jgi:hypothetical protein